MVRHLHHSGSSVRVAFLVLLAAVGVGPKLDAAEITAFVSGAKPGADWGRGYGGMLSISLLDTVHADLEGAWQGAEAPSTRMLSASAKAYIGPTMGRLVPYAGLGVGVFRQSGDAVASDSGRLGLAFVGAKLNFPIGVVVRGEWQWIDVPDDAPLPMDKRFFLGAGLRF